jgi:RimJ/RimL family protein N-acetyltransferase
MHPEPCFERGAFSLRRPRPDDARALLVFQLRNHEHFASTSPTRPPDFASEAFWAERIARNQRNFEEDRGCTMYLFEGAERIVGQVNLRPGQPLAPESAQRAAARAPRLSA